MMNCPVSGWSVPALMLRKYFLRNPWGTARNSYPGVSVVIPAVRASHRSGEEPIPKAPSPAFGIEQIPDPGLHLAVTSVKVSAQSRIELIRKTLQELGWASEATENQPLSIKSSFNDWLQEKRLNVAWLSVLESSLPINELVASIIYTGMSYALEEMKGTFSIHLFANFSDLPNGFLSFSNWHKLGKPVVRANQW